MRIRLALLLACLMAPASAQAAIDPQVLELYADPHEVDNQDASEVFVQGEAYFGGEDPVTVGADVQYDAQRRELGLFGMDARNIAIWQPSIEQETLWFAMSFWDLQVVAPEAATWRWTFNINGAPYQLEAVRGGLTSPSTIEGAPEAVLANLPVADRFRLLGPCLTGPSGLRCPKNRDVAGEIDMNSDRVIWKVPLALPFELGSTISPHPAGAVAAFGETFIDTVVQTASYTVLDRRVLISVRMPNAGPTLLPEHRAFVGAPLLNGRSPFFSNVLVDSLDTGVVGPTNPYEVVARACAGQRCGARVVVPISL